MSGKDNFKTEFFDKKTRHTDEKAVPLDKEDVSQAAIIDIKNGYFRGATFDGVFELASIQNPFYVGPKGLRVRVKCYWYSRHLRKGWPGFLLADADYSINTNYTGTVVRNLGRPSSDEDEQV